MAALQDAWIRWVEGEELPSWRKSLPKPPLYTKVIPKARHAPLERQAIEFDRLAQIFEQAAEIATLKDDREKNLQMAKFSYDMAKVTDMLSQKFEVRS